MFPWIWNAEVSLAQFTTWEKWGPERVTLTKPWIDWVTISTIFSSERERIHKEMKGSIILSGYRNYWIVESVNSVRKTGCGSREKRNQNPYSRSALCLSTRPVSGFNRLHTHQLDVCHYKLDWYLHLDLCLRQWVFGIRKTALIFSLNISCKVISGADEEHEWIHIQEQRWQIDAAQAATLAGETKLIRAAMEAAILSRWSTDATWLHCPLPPSHMLPGDWRSNCIMCLDYPMNKLAGSFWPRVL